ncbi:aspartyl-phosphate phosphatase Spo0E family protein [Salisediminibacterium selenitireducens]|uniref:Sporulation stage 0, Spo0E-like regulatory phosphatase n=1 Tax=Bacillus selenitireducens (strain ATCC 700615 / DSM 15326 / MLS10) TaxID=439292 RepID=D6XXJ8_BACIE|nr:aspartyl-phosphate phosphatase Spo0E family protein [Salisediminibacterium selenitireducens]ADI00041.1 Sporulation stage 0, Spo0E-like regulatory phosphatase [[Bacillus] selenitireducens MLS10]
MKSRLLHEIESKRRNMMDAVCKYGISSSEVIRQSQELDILINQYQRLQYHQSENVAISQ